MASEERNRFEQKRRGINLSLAIGAVIATFVLFIALWLERYDPVLTDIVSQNFPAIIGLPMAALAAFIVVALFRQDEHPIEFEGIGFKFRGASGEIILWIACFAIIVGALHLLWKA